MCDVDWYLFYSFFALQSAGQAATTFLKKTFNLSFLPTVPATANIHHLREQPLLSKAYGESACRLPKDLFLRQRRKGTMQTECAHSQAGIRKRVTIISINV